MRSSNRAAFAAATYPFPARGGGGAGSAGNVISIFAAYAIQPTDDVILAYGGIYPITLPAPVKGRSVIVKDAAGNSLSQEKTVLPHAGETIDGDASYVIDINYAGIRLVADGTNWFVVNSYSGTVL